MLTRSFLSARPGLARRARGGSLLEVLVSIVIASIGLLGLAGINATAVRYGKLSQYRAIATLLVGDITERMRANPTAVAASNYQFQQDYVTQQAAIAAVNPACNSVATACTPAQMAAADIAAWRQSVRSSLPSGSVRIDRTASGASDVWIAWTDAGNEHVLTGGALECPASLGLTAADSNVRCIYFRVQV